MRNWITDKFGDKFGMLCISTSKRMLAHAFAWSKTIENIRKSWKKYEVCRYKAFLFMNIRRSSRKTKKNEIPKEQPAFGCQPAFGSHSESLTNKLFSVFLHASHMSLSCAWWKRYFFQHFTMFFIVCWSKYTTLVFKFSGANAI